MRTLPASPAPEPLPSDDLRAAPAPRDDHARAWIVASILGLAALIGLALGFGADAGAIWDEEYHFIYGEAVLRWFQSGFTDTLAFGYGNLYLYGGLFDAAAQLVARVSPLGVFETRHVLTALVAILGVVGTWRTAALLGGPRAGLLASALLVLTPAWTGHALFNPKDIPFAAFAAWAVYAAVRAALAPPPVPWRVALLAGLGAGAALGVRSGGMFLLGYVALAVAGRVALELGAVDRSARPPLRRVLLASGARLGSALVLAWAIMILAWPWAQLSPLVRPLQAAAEASRFLWNGEVLFDGAWRSSTDLPRSYLPVWFGITLPATWIVALACGGGAALAAWRGRPGRERVLATAILAIAALGPIVGAVVLRPVLYDAHRHFLFVLPPAAVLGGLAVSWAIAADAVPRWARVAVAGLFTALATFTVRDMVRLHPYEYAFFNRWAGGLAGAAGRYETDYWGASYREGVEWLVTHVDAGQGRPIRVAGCSAAFQVGYYLDTWGAGPRFVGVERDAQPDVLLATTRWDCHRTPGQVMHVVAREGVPLLYVIRLAAPGP